MITLCILRWLWIQHSKSSDVIELSLMVTDDEWKVHRAKVVHVVQLGAEEVLTMSKWTLTAFSHFCDRLKQDPVSTMQKTGLINYSSFPVWSGLDVITMVQSSIFLCIRPFSAWWHPNKQSNNQPVILGQACSWPVRITWSKLDWNFNLLKLFYILLKLALGSVVPLTMFCSLFLLQSFLFQTFMYMRFFIICLASASVSRASHVLIQVLAINNNILSALWHFMINLRS